MSSSQQLSCYMTDTLSIVTSSRLISWSKLMVPPPLSSSLISVWHGYFAILQLFYTVPTPWDTWLLVPFRSLPSMASKDLPNCVVTTWSPSPTPSYLWCARTYLGPTFALAEIMRQSSGRRSQSQQKSFAKAYLLPSTNSLCMSIPLALTRSQIINIFMLSSHSAQKPSLSNPPMHPPSLLPPLSVWTAHPFSASICK